MMLGSLLSFCLYGSILHSILWFSPATLVLVGVDFFGFLFTHFSQIAVPVVHSFSTRFSLSHSFIANSEIILFYP